MIVILLIFQKRNDFLQLLIDTAEEMKDEGKLDDKDALTENYGKDESNEMFKQSGYTKKSKLCLKVFYLMKKTTLL